MTKKNIIVVGGGAAGMIASGFAAQNKDFNVFLLEKNDKLGKKLFITGKGRCNVTNACDTEDLIANVKSNPYFLYSAFYSFDSYKTMSFFESLGVKLKIDRGNRVFPVSEKSSDIIKALKLFMQKYNVNIMLNTNVKEIVHTKDKVTKVITDKKELDVYKIIIATGGLSYPMTGSTGDGYRFAKSLGHTVTSLYPSLVPLNVKGSFIQALQGLSLKNISFEIFLNNKNIFKGFGEMLFTHFGISGPLVLKASRSVVGKSFNNMIAKIDLKPALTENELDERILKDFKKYINKSFKNSLDLLLPKKLIPVIINLSNIPPEKKVNSITKDERKALCKVIKNFTLTITGLAGYNEAVITCGGVCVDEIDPSTMQSKIIQNLYFAGEVLDLDAYTGGFNLQIAFSTGYLAGINV